MKITTTVLETKWESQQIVLYFSALSESNGGDRGACDRGVCDCGAYDRDAYGHGRDACDHGARFL